jgi:hypothetical protein
MKIINRLPISDQSWNVPTPGGVAEVKPYQMIVLISITDEGIVELPESAPRMPAVLDTGNNHNLAIRQSQVQQWVRLALPEKGQVQIGGLNVPRYAAMIWIHPNSPAANPGLAGHHPEQAHAVDRRCKPGADPRMPFVVIAQLAAKPRVL